MDGAMTEAKAKSNRAVQNRAEPPDDAGEMPHGYGVRDFVAFLVEIAREAGASDPKLSDDERAKVIDRSKLLDASVKVLLNNPEVKSGSRLITVAKGKMALYEHALWQAIGSACLITSFLVENHSQKRKLREAVAHMAEGTKKKSRIIAEVIAAETDRILKKQPTASHWRIAALIIGPVNEQLAALRIAPLKEDTIARRVEKYLETKSADRTHARSSD
jgi:hypothetical protein